MSYNEDMSEQDDQLFVVNQLSSMSFNNIDFHPAFTGSGTYDGSDNEVLENQPITQENSEDRQDSGLDDQNCNYGEENEISLFENTNSPEIPKENPPVNLNLEAQNTAKKATI